MAIAATCTALLGLLVFGLGMATSLTRGSTQTVIGFKPDPTDRLYKLVRAHGNATEYAPMLAILILYLGTRDPAAWVIWTFVIVTAARYVHAAGMLLGASLAEVQPLRFVGALVTYLGGFALVIATLVS